MGPLVRLHPQILLKHQVAKLASLISPSDRLWLVRDIPKRIVEHGVRVVLLGRTDTRDRLQLRF